MVPTANGTNIVIGAIASKRPSTQFPSPSSRGEAPKRTPWIFSVTMNETREFPMPELLNIGPGRMVERAEANGL
jgi:hypothetical protein